VLEAAGQPHADRANDVVGGVDLMIHDIDLVLRARQASVVRWRRVGGAQRPRARSTTSCLSRFRQRVWLASLTLKQDGSPQIRSLSGPLPASPGGNRFLNAASHISSPHPRNGVCRPRDLLYRNDGFIAEVSTNLDRPLYGRLWSKLPAMRARLRDSGGEWPAGSRALLLANFDRAAPSDQPSLCMTLDAPKLTGP